jgi:hypothetical protein
MIATPLADCSADLILVVVQSTAGGIGGLPLFPYVPDTLRGTG